MSWHKSTSWKQPGKDFLVEVRHITEPPLPPELAIFSSGDGHNRWFVYAYIYPKHPHFRAFSGDSIAQEAARVLPLHGGCTFVQEHLDRLGTKEGMSITVASYQVGADYHHYGDDRFTYYDAVQGNDLDFEVFVEAKALFDTLTRLGTAAIVEIENKPESDK